MANGNQNEMSEEQKRENTRETQLKILKSEGLKDLFVAAYANEQDRTSFGESGADATYNQKYLARLAKQVEEPDEGFSRVQALAALQAEQSGRSGETAYSSHELFRTAIPFYTSGIDSVTVKDILDLMPEIEKYEKLSGGDLKMYMGDFKKKNEDLYSDIMKGYISSIVNTGVGEALILSGRTGRKGLEARLNEEPEKQGANDKAA